MSLLTDGSPVLTPARRGVLRLAWDMPDRPRRLGLGAAPVSGPSTAQDASLRIEALEPADAETHREAWADLMARTLEPNVFLDPDFALSAARHLGSARRPCFVFVWAEPALSSPVLVAVCALTGGLKAPRGFASMWYHDLSAFGFPLLDRHYGAAALEGLLGWAAPGLPWARGLLFRAVPSEGPTAALLRNVATETGRRLAVIEHWERAVLRRGEAEACIGLSGKGAKERRRQHRRLSERGTLAYASAEGGEALVDAVERFLALEASGWKGRAGTALLARPGQTTFARTMTRLLARRGLCRVDSLTLDGKPIAMGIILTAGDADMFWKMAYREDVACFSPGVQFVAALTREQAARARAASTDSCAVPDHPMIDRLWRGRLLLADVAVATRPGDGVGFGFVLAMERRRRVLRALAKRVVTAWRRRHSGVESGLPGAVDPSSGGR